jgi:type II secretory pathway component PulK
MKRTARQRGVALLLVLWAFMILGVLAMDFGRYMRDDAMAAVNFAEETQGYYAAVAAINRQLFEAANRLNGIVPEGVQAPTGDDAGDDEEDDLMPTDGEWHQGTFHGASYEVRAVDECGRIAINPLALKAGQAGGENERERLKRIVTNVMYGPNQTSGKSQREAQDVDAIVDAIIDWVDPDHQTTNGAERDWYRANRDYEPKDGFFDSPDELLLVRGVTADLFYGIDGRPGLRDVISVACRGEERAEALNAKTVTAPVLEVAFGLDPQEAADLIEQRKGADGETFIPILQSAVAARDPAMAERVVWEAARIVSVEARADTSRERNQSTVEALVDLTDEVSDGPNPLRWFDRAPWTGSLPGGSVPDRAEPTS